MFDRTTGLLKLRADLDEDQEGKYDFINKINY